MRDLEQVSVRLPKPLARRLRLHAADTGKTVQEIVATMIEDHVPALRVVREDRTPSAVNLRERSVVE